GLQLLVKGVAAAHAALVQQADGRHVGEGLADAYLRGGQGSRAGAEEVQRADDLLAQPHRQGLHGGEARLLGGGGGPRPAVGWGGHVPRIDGPAGPEAVHPGALVAFRWHSSSSRAASLEAATTRSS